MSTTMTTNTHNRWIKTCCISWANVASFTVSPALFIRWRLTARTTAFQLRHPGSNTWHELINLIFKLRTFVNQQHLSLTMEENIVRKRTCWKRFPLKEVRSPLIVLYSHWASMTDYGLNPRLRCNPCPEVGRTMSY